MRTIAFLAVLLCMSCIQTEAAPAKGKPSAAAAKAAAATRRPPPRTATRRVPRATPAVKAKAAAGGKRGGSAAKGGKRGGSAAKVGKGKPARGMALIRSRVKARLVSLRRRAVMAMVRSRARLHALRARLGGPAPGSGAIAFVPAKLLFSEKRAAAPLASRAIGSYARGCLAGGKMLPVSGPTWQAMRLSRNRNWGHPALIAFIERLAEDGRRFDDWPGLLVGDMAQPMGGPMATGHASHQIGLDADLWLTPMPDRRLSKREREDIAATSMLSADDATKVDPAIWTERHKAIIRRAAIDAEVARVFVHPAIKKALCEAAGAERAWLTKVRPWHGHHYHFHVRMACPAGDETCINQPEQLGDDGCTAELDGWLKRVAGSARPQPQVAARLEPRPVYRARETTVGDLPAQCTEVLASDGMPVVASIPVPSRAAPATPVAAAGVAVPAGSGKPDAAQAPPGPGLAASPPSDAVAPQLSVAPSPPVIAP